MNFKCLSLFGVVACFAVTSCEAFLTAKTTPLSVFLPSGVSTSIEASLFTPTPHASRMRSLKLARESEERSKKIKVDPLVKQTSALTRRLSWFSWWSQLILTVISSVTLVFARNVIRQSHTSITEANSLPNFVLAGGGIVFSFASIFWTWAFRRLARRLLRKATTRIQCANLLRKTIDVGVTINLLGMLFTIIGAEQIVGALAIKALTASRAISLVESNSMLQPLDILVVQANTNTLFSHFSSLVALLYLSRQIRKLDPPSREGDERTN
jgi:hypothetical protein